MKYWYFFENPIKPLFDSPHAILSKSLQYCVGFNSVNLCKSQGVRFTTLPPRGKIGIVEPTQYLRDSERMTPWKSLRGSVVNVVPREVPQVIRLSFGAAPLRTV